MNTNQAPTAGMTNHLAVLVNRNGTHNVLILAQGPTDMRTLRIAWNGFYKSGVTVPGGWAKSGAPNKLTLTPVNSN